MRCIIPTGCEAFVELILGLFQTTLEDCDTRQVCFVLQVFELFAPLHLLHQEVGIVHRDFKWQLAPSHRKQVACAFGRVFQGLIGFVEAGRLLQCQALLTLGSVSEAVRMHPTRQLSVARGKLLKVQPKARLQLE